MIETRPASNHVESKKQNFSKIREMLQRCIDESLLSFSHSSRRDTLPKELIPEMLQLMELENRYNVDHVNIELEASFDEGKKETFSKLLVTILIYSGNPGEETGIQLKDHHEYEVPVQLKIRND